MRPPDRVGDAGERCSVERLLGPVLRQRPALLALPRPPLARAAHGGPARVRVDEAHEHLHRRQLDVVDHEHTAGAQHRAGVEPVDRGEREGVAPVDQHEVDLHVCGLEARERAVGGPDLEAQTLDTDPALLAVREDAVGLLLARGAAGVLSAQRREQHGRQPGPGLEGAGARRAALRHEPVAGGLGGPHAHPRLLGGLHRVHGRWIGEHVLHDGEALGRFRRHDGGHYCLASVGGSRDLREATWTSPWSHRPTSA